MLTEKVNKIKSNINYLMIKTSPVVMGISTAAGIILADHVMAEADAAGLLTGIIDIIADLIIALGVILAIMGIVNYASAHSEGDGPAQNKAIGKIAAGVMLVALSVILKSDTGHNLVTGALGA